MTTPTAPLTTAAEMAREFFRIDPDAVLTPAVERCVADLAAFLITYAAQIRRDAAERAIAICDQRAKHWREKAHAATDDDSRLKFIGLWTGSECAGIHIKEELISALPPGSPSSQTDTGDS